MRELIEKFKQQTEEILSEVDRKAIGVRDYREAMKRIDERVQDSVSSYNNQYIGHPLVPIQGKDSDSELIFRFEDYEDAEDMYYFFVESKLLEPGEVVLRDIEGQHSVAFMPHVIVTKPEIIEAALLVYEDQLVLEDEEDEEAFEALVVNLSKSLSETYNKVAGAPKRKPGMGNPFHDKDGKFAGVEKADDQKGGSWAVGKTKLKFSGRAGKGIRGKGITARYGSTSHPCGRAAREVGDNRRCWDGSELEGLDLPLGRALAEAMRNKIAGKEESVFDMSTLMELRRKYSV